VWGWSWAGLVLSGLEAEGKECSAPKGSLGGRVWFYSFIVLPLFARLEALNRRIATPPQCQIDPLQHDVMDFLLLMPRIESVMKRN
jgi:hypothetical protein